MKLRKRNILLLIGVTALLLVSASSSVGNASINNPVVFGTIDDAFYADLDHQNDTYDIQYNVSVFISDFTTSDKWLLFKPCCGS